MVVLKPFVSGSAYIAKVDAIVYSWGVVWPREPIVPSFTLGGTNQLLRTTFFA